MQEEIIIKPIGIIETPFKQNKDLRIPPFKPEAPYHDPDIKGTVHLKPEFLAGIKDIKVGNSLILLFHFNRSQGYQMVNNSLSFDQPVGVFSTRSPHRPNGIGLTIVKVVSIYESGFTFQGVDMLDGTPLLDIKPYGAKKPLKQRA